jgi:hypothetical protein
VREKSPHPLFGASNNDAMMNAYKDSNLDAATAANLLTKIEVYGKAQLQAFAASLGFTAVTAHAAGLSAQEMAASVSTLSQVSGSHGIRRRHTCALAE